MPIFETLFKRIFRYILNRYFGEYLVNFTQKDITFSIRRSSVEDLQLNVKAFNDLCEEYNLPVEFLHGSVDKISIFIPWPSLLQDNTTIDVHGLKLVVQPKQRSQDASVFDSVWGSMTSSMQHIEDFLNSKTNDDDGEVIEVTPIQSDGLESIARTIDTVLANIKMRFESSSLKIEYVLPNKSTGISLEVKVASAEYFDEAGVNAPSGHGHDSDKNYFEPSAYSFKRVVFEGVSLYTAEFSTQEREFSTVQQMFSSEGMDSTHFVPGSPEMPPPHSTLPMKKSEPNFSCDPVLISRLNGQQELGLKLKQNEAFIGPKVDVEFNFGAFNLFLTPQQVHLLFTLMNGLIEPDINCDTSKNGQSGMANKPMKEKDYEMVQEEFSKKFQQAISGVMPKSLKNQQGWSSHSLDESDEDFHLMTMENKTSSENAPSISSQDDLLSSSVNSDTRSDYVGTFPCNQRTKSKGSVEAILTDPLSELTHFHGCISSLLVIILHDDSVQETCTGDKVSDCVSLKGQAETFFSDLRNLQMSGFNFKDFLSAREPISKLCETNHLRLMASGIIFDGNEESSSVERIMKFNVSVHQAEILEYLFNSPLSSETQNPKYMQLLSFENQKDSFLEQKHSCLKLKYSQTECTSQNRTYKPPANKLDIELGAMLTDVDISLTDRIRTLLNFSNTVHNTENKWNQWRDSDVGMVTQTSSKTEISITSPFVTVNLRFPIPDLRSVHNMDRAPWWQQNIYKEILILELQEVSFKTTLDDDELFKKYEIQCQDVHGLFKIPNVEDPISFLRVSVDPDVDEDSRRSGFDWPRLVIQRMTKVVSPDLETRLEETDELFSCSLSYAIMSNLASDPSPFCTTSVVHDSSETNANLSSDHNEVIKPADKEGLVNFVEKTVNKSECVFEFTLPAVNIVFPDKDIFELLYNRLGNGLLLWTNTSLTTTNTYDTAGFKVHIPGFDVSYSKGHSYEQFPIFKPFSNDCLFDSNSDSEEEETLYMSVHEYYQRQKQKHKKSSDTSVTKLSLSFSITKGSLVVNTPLLDDVNELVPDHCGKLQLWVEDCTIFLASSYQGDPNESYMCLLAEKSALYHEGVAQLENKYPVVPSLNGCKNNNLRCIIYESDPGMHLIKSLISNKEMLKFAVHIVHSPKQQIKTIKVAIEISSATLRHYVLPSPQMWINQLIDFLKVDEFPVNGYIPPAVVTELHLNLSNCAVDYRPFKLPYRTALTVENFNMSCNVTATTPSFLFRVISEELRLFISSKIETKKVDLRKNYVCVIDTGLIDISVKTSVDEKENPKIEMSVSNNKVHIRTCSDSCKALLDIILYLSANGDMETKVSDEQENENKSFDKSKSFDSDSQNLDILMAEAMKECSLNGNNEKYSKNTNFDYSATDDEFCILEDDPGVGLIPKNGEPQIRMLTDEPIKIIENHFSIPPGKSDVLKAPKHFPNPIFQVTLQEMCLIWHLYGGYDFKNTESDSKKKHKKSNSENIYRSKHAVTFSDQDSLDNASLGFCKVTPMPKSFDSSIVHFSMEHVTINDNQRSSSPESWLHIGGSGRNHDVLMELQMTKVQFQREIYAPDSQYSSRYILLIYDIEIRDRLAVSQINKFLYQYATKDLPRQSHANMIDIKAVYTRPDLKRTTEECSLRVSCKPLRLNVDQDSLMFLVDFFQDLLGVPIPEISEGSDGEVHEEKTVPSRCNFSANINTSPKVTPVSETFYRFFSFSPDVLIKIDYHGKRVQMEQGALRGLIMGLGQLNASEIRLKRLCYRHGLLGHNKLVSYALNEWQQDILKNQLPSLLGGVGPMHSFVQLFQGMKDLVYLPIAQYRKDGQIVRGLQRGASSFSTSTVIAFLDLSSRFFYAVQGTAEVAYDMVSPGPRFSGKSIDPYRKNSQPADIIEGVSTAINVMKEGLGDTYRTIYRVASTEHEHKGVPGAVGGVLRQIPPSLFKPIILGSEATSYVLDGARHQLMPDAHQEDIHKWRTKN